MNVIGPNEVQNKVIATDSASNLVDHDLALDAVNLNDIIENEDADDDKGICLCSHQQCATRRLNLVADCKAALTNSPAYKDLFVLDKANVGQCGASPRQVCNHTALFVTLLESSVFH